MEEEEHGFPRVLSSAAPLPTARLTVLWAVCSQNSAHEQTEHGQWQNVSPLQPAEESLLP